MWNFFNHKISSFYWTFNTNILNIFIYQKNSIFKLHSNSISFTFSSINFHLRSFIPLNSNRQFSHKNKKLRFFIAESTQMEIRLITDQVPEISFTHWKRKIIRAWKKMRWQSQTSFISISGRECTT